MTSKLIADIRADLERFRSGVDPTLDVENILDLIAENERLQREGEASAALARLYGEAKDRAQAENERLRAEIEALRFEVKTWRGTALGDISLNEAAEVFARKGSTGGAWADLQSETEAIDGDQVLW